MWRERAKRGPRPRAGAPARRRVTIRFTDAEHARIRDLIGGMRISTWLRTVALNVVDGRITFTRAVP